MCKEETSTKVRLFIPQDISSLDECIAKHVVKEMRSVLLDGMSDLDEYGDGFKWNVLVEIKFEKVEE